eukprot:TRINITY_DN451_c0_g1_i1.p1 TRINITY_DN451_c0_g1~~TRINITY_DN451_c0_g1_i1.p1  ORF type:complete len:391 (-),score=88.20 TRINITY_DN451_c0_g1_i1:1774-2946(-)
MLKMLITWEVINEHMWINRVRRATRLTRKHKCTRLCHTFGLGAPQSSIISRSSLVYTGTRGYHTISPQFQEVEKLVNENVEDVDNMEILPSFLLEEHPIIDINEANFAEAVKNSQVPLFLDCFVPGKPSKISEFLAKQVKKEKGGVQIARIDLSQNPRIAQTLGISQPSACGLFQGQRFPEVLQDDSIERRIETWSTAILQRCYMPVVSELHQTAQALLEAKDENETNFLKAKKMYQTLVENRFLRGVPLGLAGLAQCSLIDDNVEEATQFVNVLKENYQDDLSATFIAQIISKVELKESGFDTNVSETELLQKIEEEPDNLQLQYDLSRYYDSTGKTEDAINHLLKIVKKDKEWNDSEAMNHLLKILKSLGPGNELAVKGRKKLSNILY